MKIAIVSGKSEGPIPLNAFDNALTDAKIGDVNLIKVSSMLGPKTTIRNLSDNEFIPGSMVNCVLSEITSNNPGETISACVAVAIGENLGCVVEHSATNQDEETTCKEALTMVKYMMEVRQENILELIVEEISHTVEKCGSVVASVVYLDY